MLITSAVSLAITTISVTVPVVFYCTIKDCCFPKKAPNDRDFKTVSFIRINDSD
ncbi:30348_t:CDS:2, partial [Racocetra persica]